MTFSEFKFSLKREKPLGTIKYYTVPASLNSFGVSPNNKFINIPAECSVTITANENGKKVLNFHGGFGVSEPKDSYFFFEDEFELADVRATKLQMFHHEKLIQHLREFEDKTKINSRIDKYLDKYPEVFL